MLRPSAHPSVGKGHREAEEAQVAGPNPERTAQRAQHGIPLHQAGGIGKGVAQHQPGPGNLCNGEIMPLPRHPGGGQEKVGQHAGRAALDPAEATEDDAHLQGIGQDGEDGASHRRSCYPPGGNGVPENERAVMPPPEVLYLLLRGQPFQDEQGQQAHQGRPAHVRRQPRQAHQERKAQSQGQEYERTVFHRSKGNKIPLFYCYLCRDN